METIYVLRSVKNSKLYVGRTGRDPFRRLAEHNAGGCKWTTGNRPFELTYLENYEVLSLAQKREKFLKTGKGRIVLKNLESGGWNGLVKSDTLPTSHLKHPSFGGHSSIG